MLTSESGYVGTTESQQPKNLSRSFSKQSTTNSSLLFTSFLNGNGCYPDFSRDEEKLYGVFSHSSDKISTDAHHQMNNLLSKDCGSLADSKSSDSFYSISDRGA